MTKYFATVARGLEAIAAQELSNLGAKAVTGGFAGVAFEGNQELLYRVNLWGRTLFRVLQPIATIKSENRQQLYREVQKIDWRTYLTAEKTLAVHCTGSNAELNHSHFTALEIKNAIVDQQRQQSNQRSSVDPNRPDLLLNAHIYQDQCLLSLDSSGESLHRRGYRPAMGLAPLKETLAAALIMMSGWRPQIPLLDPLCGSGTIPIEAGLQALNIAPGLYRDWFAFQNWSDFNPRLWDSLVKEAQASRLSSLPSPIIGSEADPTILKQAKTNARLCGIFPPLQLLETSLENLQPPAEQGIILTNPPYGKRLGDAESLGSFYKLLGDVLKQRFTGWTAYVLCGNQDLIKKIGLRPARRLPVYNGSLPCTLSEYQLY